MSDPTNLTSEDQSQRWLKYGSNTAIVCVVAVALAVLAVYIAQRKDKRWDTTASAQYTLKPQTLKVIDDNAQHIQITSFYTKAKKTDAAYGTNTAAADADASSTVDHQADVVADLLDEYATRGRNISVEEIDPKLNPSKADALIEQVTDQYGGEVKKYKAFTEALPDRFKRISDLATAEAAKVAPLAKQLPNTQDMQQVTEALGTVGAIPDLLKSYQKAYEQLLHQKPPDYKGVTLSVSASMDKLSSQLLGPMIRGFQGNKETKDVPAPLQQYMAAAIPTYQKLQADVDTLSKEAKGLGELKLDTIREALHQDNAILVRGDHDWKVIRYDQVWKSDSRGTNGQPAKPRFAGEQMITTAILSLDRPAKTKVCFVRAAGGPLVAAGQSFSSLGDRLRDYNFDVTEKDLSGRSQQQQGQFGQPPPAEPTDADIDDAIWVVLAVEPQQEQNPMMGSMPPPQILPPKVADHLANGHHYDAAGKKVAGGLAYVWAVTHGDALDEALRPYGITVRTDAVACHALVPQDEGAASDPDDIMNAAAHVPYIFPIRDWGSSPITDTMRSLPGVALDACPIVTTAAAGATVWPLMPIPTDPPSWGETDLESIRTGPKFDARADIAAPVYGAAASELTNGSRVVVCGSPGSFQGDDLGIDTNNNLVDMPDPQQRAKGVYSPLFPGDAEFFMDGIFWLARDEPMIAMSPSALSVPRIGPMNHVGQGFWHVGVLLVGLPGLVLAAGVAAYLSRRD